MHRPADFNHPLSLLQALYPGSFPDTPSKPESQPQRLPGALLTTTEAADYLNVTPETVRVLVRRKTIDVVKITPRDYRFRLGDLESFVASRLHRRDSALRRGR